ncbi:hypothetical protein ACBJ59_57550 [Nonomuraea sp. MTCD27]|uniref:hypothetical protein n=1 Tax=Nonomuraea sp. MTCD27 TaxID=1676747 RepID=UPI0035C03C40
MMEFMRGIRMPVSTVDACVGEDSVHEGGELPIPVSDQKACSAACVFQVHHEVPDRLDHPVGGRVSGGAQYANAPAGVLDDGQDVLALPVQGDGLDEIAGEQSVGLGAQEVGPCGGCPLGCWINAFLLEDLPDCGRRDLDAECGELTMYPPIAPAGVLPNQAQDEGADGADRGSAPTSVRLAGTGVTPSHQVAVPAQDGVRTDEKPQPARNLTRQ